MSLSNHLEIAKEHANATPNIQAQQELHHIFGSKVPHILGDFCVMQD